MLRKTGTDPTGKTGREEGRWIALYLQELLKYKEVFYNSLFDSLCGSLLQSTW